MARADGSATGGVMRCVVLGTLAVITLGWGGGPSDTVSGHALDPDRSKRGRSYSAPHARFSVTIDGLDVNLRQLAVSVVPGDTVRIASDTHDLAVTHASGQLRRTARGTWQWTAPAAGFHAVELVSESMADTIGVTFMVVRPASEMRDGRLQGYAIGSYRARPPSMSASYEPPDGFVEVHPEHHALRVSPNFTLGQFLCKQPGNPRFALVSAPLLMKLEAILAAVTDASHAVPTLTVMSGFRTPAYNRAIGNTTDFSRHLWGDAADVYVDADGDGRIDDLNRDGRVDIADAQWLASLVDRVMANDDETLMPGGLSTYQANAVHGPFVHVDARGHRARW